MIQQRIEFALFVCLAVATAFGHFSIVSFLRRLKAKGKGWHWLAAIWLAVYGLFWVTLRAALDFQQLASLFAEISGAAILAAEVRFAQSIEKYRGMVEKSVELVAIRRPSAHPLPMTTTDFNEYVGYMDEAYSIQGETMPEAERKLLSQGNATALVDAGRFIESQPAFLAKHKKKLASIDRVSEKYRPKLLWVGLLLIVAGLTGHGLHALVSEPEAARTIETFFMAGAKLEYDSGSIVPTDLAGVCNAKKKLAKGHSRAAFVVAGHDQMPLSKSARLKFSSNASLARLRGERVAETLRKADECGPGIPNVIVVFRPPRHVEAAATEPIHEDREVEVYGAGYDELKTLLEIEPSPSLH